jgi:hypothetical protein
VASIEEIAMIENEQANKALVLEAFDTLFNRRDYAAAQRFWSPDYIQHSAFFESAETGCSMRSRPTRRTCATTMR